MKKLKRRFYLWVVLGPKKKRSTTRITSRLSRDVDDVTVYTQKEPVLIITGKSGDPELDRYLDKLVKYGLAQFEERAQQKKENDVQ